jgi:hypothetical protein
MPADADRGGDVVHDLQPEHQVALGVSLTGNTDQLRWRRTPPGKPRSHLSATDREA